VLILLYEGYDILEEPLLGEKWEESWVNMRQAH
jgi:hypothetical protein